MFSKALKSGVVFLLAFPMVIVAADRTVTPAHLTATQIVAKNVAARGGLAAWRSIHTVSMAGTMDAGKGVQLPFVLQMKRPRKTRLELSFDGKTAVQVYDGVNGWKKRPFLGHSDAEPFTSEELKLASLQSDLDGLLIDCSSKGTKVEVESVEKVEDRDAFKLKVTLKNDQVRHVWVDAETFLEVKVDGVRRMDGRMRVMETYFRNYKPASGVVLPFLLETSVERVKGTERINIDSVKINLELADSSFTRPLP